MCTEQKMQRGITLVEQIIFIVVVSVGVIGLVSVMNPLIRSSADPMVLKQQVAIAESVLNEVLHQPFTWCDPDDANASTAQAYTGPNGCATDPQNISGPRPAGEGRIGGVGAVYDNVADYGGWNTANASDATGANVMAGYGVAVAVANAGAALGLGDDTAALRIDVTVTRNGDPFTLTGYRFRYAPRY